MHPAPPPGRRGQHVRRSPQAADSVLQADDGRRRLRLDVCAARRGEGGSSAASVRADGLGDRGEHLSVMIPTYNGADLLEATLNSLADQGLDRAQVEVVDDCSTVGDPEKLVDRVGRGRVGFFRHAANMGMVHNFNACVERAERRWVHILHGDDFVLPGAYEAFDGLLERVPTSRALFGRCVTVDSRGRWRGTTQLLGAGDEGPLVYDTLTWAFCPVQFAGVLFERTAVDEVGRFDTVLSHTADWDLWWRLGRSVAVAYTNRCVGAYRQFEDNHTSQLRPSAQNIVEYLDQLHRIADADGRVGSDVFAAAFREAVHQGRGYAGETGPLLAHLRVLARFPAGLPRTRAISRLALAHAFEVADRHRR